jgi:hypothetical protein
VGSGGGVLVNLARKAWLGIRVKQILGGNMEAIKAVGNWLFKLQIIPSGYATLAGGWLSILFYLACILHIQIGGLPCPDNPVEALSVGLVGIGLGRRKQA